MTKTPLSKDERAELKRLRTIVERVERDLQWIYRKYFPFEKRPVRLPFRTYLEMLIVKGRHLGRAGVATTEVRKMLRDNLTNIVSEAIKKNSPRIQQALVIPVLIQPNPDMEIMKYRAIALRGSISHAKGMTPEDAWERLKGYLAEAIQNRPEIVALKFTVELMPKYREAAPFLFDRILGFDVNVRKAPEFSVATDGR